MKTSATQQIRHDESRGTAPALASVVVVAAVLQLALGLSRADAFRLASSAPPAATLRAGVERVCAAVTLRRVSEPGDDAWLTGPAWGESVAAFHASPPSSGTRIAGSSWVEDAGARGESGTAPPIA